MYLNLYLRYSHQTIQMCMDNIHVEGYVSLFGASFLLYINVNNR